jgi:hypothetical protein
VLNPDRRVEPDDTATYRLRRTLKKELSQPTASKGTRMRLVIDKQA